MGEFESNIENPTLGKSAWTNQDISEVLPRITFSSQPLRGGNEIVFKCTGLARHAGLIHVAPLFLIGLLFLPQAIGATPLAGVKAGDWALYVVDQHATGNSTLVRNYQEKYIVYANASYVRLNVTQVVGGSNVSLIEDIHYSNGSDTRIQTLVDVSQGVTIDNPPRVLMANTTTLTFLSTGNFSYVPRTVNNLEVDSASGGNSSALRYSWDEFTGILVSEQFVYNVAVSDTNTGTFTYTLAMTSTSLWHYVPPKPPVSNPPTPFDLGFAELYVSVGVVGALALGVVAYARRRPRDAKGPAKRRA
jgi:hypothetical protein